MSDTAPTEAPPPKRVTRAAIAGAWLASHPGWHRPVDVGAATGMTTHEAATALHRLADAGQALRHRAVTASGYRHSVYRSPGDAS